MPTYQYVCTSCEAPLEVVQSFSDPSLTECPACDGGRLRKVFSAVGVVFKGSGFYRTDNRAGGKSGAAAGGDAVGTASRPPPRPTRHRRPRASRRLPARRRPRRRRPPSPSSATAKPAAKSA